MLVTIFIWFSGATELETTVITLVCLLIFPALLKLTFIEDFSPGKIGSLFHSVAVQPHVT